MICMPPITPVSRPGHRPESAIRAALGWERVTVRNSRWSPPNEQVSDDMVDYLAFGLIAWVAPEPGYLRGAGRPDQRSHDACGSAFAPSHDCPPGVAVRPA